MLLELPFSEENIHSLTAVRSSQIYGLPLCRTFPLEEHGHQVGALTIRAWIALPSEVQTASFNHDLDSSGMLPKERRDSNLGVGSNTDDNIGGKRNLQNTEKNEGDGDDNLFFELSESSGGSSGVLIPSTRKNSVEINTVFESLDGVDNEGNFDLKQPHESENQRGRSGTLSAFETPPGDLDGGFGAAVTGVEQHVMTRMEHSRRRSSTESPAAGVHEHASRGLLSERAVVPSSPVGAPCPETRDCQQDPTRLLSHAYTEKDRRKKWTSPATPAGVLQPVHQMGFHESTSKQDTLDTADCGVESESQQSLDLALAMLPLIPSFPQGSAEVRVRVHGMLIPCTSNLPASPPYVRASLHPGVSSIARTGVPVIGSTSTTAPNARNKRSGGVLLAGNSPAERVVEYVFRGKSGDADANNCVLSLPLEPEVADRMSEKNGGCSPPTLRLEIVSGRSLGCCDLALPEAMRHPGAAFQKLQLSVRKEERSQGNPEMTAAAGQRRCGEGLIIIGKMNVDIGVTLSGEPEDLIPDMKRGALELTTGVVAVEALDIRVRDSSGGGRVDLLNGVRRPEFIGVSATLTLGGGKPKLAFFGVGECGRNGSEGSGSDRATVRRGVSLNGGKIVLKSTCAKLDILTMKLVQREEVIRSTAGDPGLARRDAEQWQGEECRGGGGRGGRRRNVVKIAVSDINDIFEGRSRWVRMYHDYFEVGGDSPKWSYLENNATFRIEADRARPCLEVQLRLSLTDTAPFRPREHRHSSASYEGAPSVTDKLSPRKSVSVTYPHTEQNLTNVGAIPDPPPVAGVPQSALEAWDTFLGNGCCEARVIFSPEDNHNQRNAILHTRGDSGRFHSQVGPGVLEMEVLAIHGRGEESRSVIAVVGKEGNDVGNRDTSIPRTSSQFWVRVTYLNNRKGGGRGSGDGRSGVIVVDSPPGDTTFMEQAELCRDGEPAFAERPSGQDREKRCGGDWIVRWRRGVGVLARCPVHWTSSQSVLPVILFEVFNGQVWFSTMCP